ncbi:MAG TPA: xanthine dehydrogenase family protein subunit M [Jiangellaceae bacterium]|nr:xanthine dehydrogenase family protein subunit M [Jiangellaceae bacterium]
MIPFDYERAPDAESAVTTVAQWPSARFLAGGTNLVDHMKLGVDNPELLVDINGLSLDQIEVLPDGGLHVGAGVLNSDLAAHPQVRAYYPVLSQALLAGASAQLRNMATTGGNLLQRTRCVYFQDVTTPCNKREPGTGCSAIEGSYTSYHAVLGASEHCVAVHPSDMAVAMAALDADVVVLGPDGERQVPLMDLHRLPSDDPSRDTQLNHGELITAVDLPAPSGGRSAYRKVRDRASYAFALVSVAAVLEVDDGLVRTARIALGGLAHKPWRAERAEQALVGAPATEDTFRQAASRELEQARPLSGNEFKVPMARNTITAVLRDLADQSSDASEQGSQDG